MLEVQKAASAEEITQYGSVEKKNLRMRDMKQNTHRERERERERERHKGISLLTRIQQLQCKSNNNQLKVTKSLYIVTHLGQLPFMIFTQMA